MRPVGASCLRSIFCGTHEGTIGVTVMVDPTFKELLIVFPLQ